MRVDALECCVQLVHRVQERLALLANPAVPPLVGGAGDQEEWVGQPSEEQEEGQFEYLTAEMAQLLQREQLSVEGFSLVVLSHGAQTVKDVVAEGPDQSLRPVLGAVSQLVCAGGELLKVCCAGEGGLDTTHDTVRAVCSAFGLVAVWWGVVPTHGTALLHHRHCCSSSSFPSRSGRLSRVCLTSWHTASASGGDG